MAGIVFGVLGGVAVQPIVNGIPAVFGGLTTTTVEFCSTSNGEIFRALIESLETEVLTHSPYLTAELVPNEDMKPPQPKFNAFSYDQPTVPDLVEQVKGSASTRRKVQMRVGYGSWVFSLSTGVQSTWWVWWNRERMETQQSPIVPEKLRITCLYTNAQKLTSLIERAVSAYEKRREDKVRVYAFILQQWNLSRELPLRPLRTIVLPGNTAQDIQRDIAWFLSTTGKTWYAERGFNYRRGYLFQGVPGSGKTSLVFALASEFRLGVYVLPLSSREVDDISLQLMLSKVPANSIILLEDVDAAFNGRRSRCGVTMSGLLNSLDGLTSYYGSILVMTTNHPENLDPALIRPGRADRTFAFSNTDLQQVTTYLGIHAPHITQARVHGLFQSGVISSMAALQGLVIGVQTLQLNGMNLDNAVDAWEQQEMVRLAMRPQLHQDSDSEMSSD